MSIITGQEAMIRRIVTMDTDANVVVPQGSAKDLPRYVIQAAGGAQRPKSLDGYVEADPEIAVNVETKAGEYTTENDALVAELEARFRVGSRFDGVVIMTPPSVRPPLPVSSGVYTVPVIIRARFYY